MRFVILVFSICLSVNVLAGTRPCTKKNDYGDGCISKTEFFDIIESILSEYETDFKKAGWKLQSKSDWSDRTEDATYDFDFTNKIVFMEIYGGLARAKEITAASLATVVCHELGHVYGFIIGEGDSSGAEGEADYFAASKCGPRILQKTNFSTNMKLPIQVVSSCQNSNHLKPTICESINKAGYGVARLRARVLQQSAPSFLTPDPNEVNETSGETNAQCGLDTFYAGSLNKPRPRCWYKP